MPIFDFADTVVVPFPFVDMPVSKRRPALIISNRQFAQESGHTVLAMITTAARSAWTTDVVIADNQSAGFSHPSTVRWKLFTLPNELILRLLGHLADSDRRAVRHYLDQIFAGS